MESIVPFIIFGAFVLGAIGKAFAPRRRRRQFRPPAARISTSSRPASRAATPRPGQDSEAPNLGTLLRQGLSCDLMLEYADRNGEITSRKVTVRKIYGKTRRNGGYFVNWLVGYCHLRREERQFRVSNIISVSQAGSLYGADRKMIEPWLGALFQCRPDMDISQLQQRIDRARSHTVTAPEVLLVWRDGGLREEYSATILTIAAYADGTITEVRTRAHRPKSAGQRAWTGRRTFTLPDPPTSPTQFFESIALAETGEILAEPHDWLFGLWQAGTDTTD